MKKTVPSDSNALKYMFKNNRYPAMQELRLNRDFLHRLLLRRRHCQSRPLRLARRSTALSPFVEFDFLAACARSAGFSAGACISALRSGMKSGHLCLV